MLRKTMKAMVQTMKYDPNLIYLGRKITPLARDIIRLSGNTAPKVVDIGCYKRPVFGFLQKEFPQVSLLGVDEDPEAIAWLLQNGFDACSFSEFSNRGAVDFSFALEVIEHVKPTESKDFFHTIISQTKVGMFFTTPNFSGFTAKARDEVSRLQKLQELRYLPDHLKNFKGKSTNPHHHKQAFNGDRLVEDIVAVLPKGWDFSVFEAWPWRIEDFSVGTTFIHAFKLYGVIWNMAAFPSDVYTEVIGAVMKKKIDIAGLGIRDPSSAIMI